MSISYEIKHKTGNEIQTERRGMTLEYAQSYMRNLATDLRNKGNDIVYSGDSIRVKSYLNPFRLMFDQIEIIQQQEYFISASENPLLEQNAEPILYSGDF